MPTQPEIINMSSNRDELIRSVNNYLKADFPLGEGLEQVKNEVKWYATELAKHNQYHLIRELYYKIYINEDANFEFTEEDRQGLAKSIFADTALSGEYRVDEALRWLEKRTTIYNSTNVETYGLAGAIFTQRWRSTADAGFLYKAKLFFERGMSYWNKAINNNIHYIVSADNDFGNCAINLANSKEQLAIHRLLLSSKIIAPPPSVDRYIIEVQDHRELIIKHYYDYKKGNLHHQLNDSNTGALPINNTIAHIYRIVIEALLGCNKYEEATQLIVHYNINYKDEWQNGALLLQLRAVLANKEVLSKEFATHKTAAFNVALEHFDVKKFEQCLLSLLGLKQLPSNSAKTGLALSGGGFRASYFHIGMLAALAENDLLNNVEVISCVSGGSIIGAYYHLYLQELLERKCDAEIQKEDYIKLIKDLTNAFHQAVQKNLRVNIFSNLIDTFRILFFDSYSRSLRVAKLYDKLFYEAAYKKLGGANSKKKNPDMDDTKIHPKLCKENALDEATSSTEYQQLENDLDTKFNPRLHNYKRINKVPILILNATNLNSGHNFQFTSSWLGESPFSINPKINAKARYKRLYYSELPERNPYKRVPLSLAVACSSCVPAMFPAVEFNGLYDGKQISLVDGGVCDNQGLIGIVENECKVLYVSDASGQMQSNQFLIRNILGETYRASAVASERIREMQLNITSTRAKAGYYDEFHLMHLREGIAEVPIGQANNEAVQTQFNTERTNNSFTPSGVSKKLQAKLATIRTDLDSFSDIEANLLMANGYAQTIASIRKTSKAINDDHNWHFKAPSTCLQNPAILNFLNVSDRVFGKRTTLIMQKLKEKNLIIILLLIALLLFGYFYREELLSVSISLFALLNNLVSTVMQPKVAKGLGFLFLLELCKRLVFRGQLKKISLLAIVPKLIMLPLLLIGTMIYNYFYFNKWYLKIGKWDNLLNIDKNKNKK
jgi:predicted acylesterase/phospholipase RssA